jgi:hypothetical protein
MYPIDFTYGCKGSLASVWRAGALLSEDGQGTGFSFFSLLSGSAENKSVCRMWTGMCTKQS